MASFAVVGKALPRVDAKEKVTGDAVYCADFKLPRMLYGKILRSPYSHARVLNVDVSQAVLAPGVKAAITADDTPKVKFGIMRPDELALALDKVRYVGDEVAAVVAVDEDAAEAALSLIKVEYEELPGVYDTEEAMKPGAPAIHDHVQNNVALFLDYQRGDVNQGFKESDLIIEESFETSTAHQCYTEPRGVTASWDASGRLTLWGPFQSLFLYRDLVLCKALGIDPARIRIIQPYVGGAFGGKFDSSKAVIAALLARKTGRPVRIVNTREEELRAGRPSVSAKIHHRIGFKKDGTIMAKESRALVDNGAYCSSCVALVEVLICRNENLYRLKNSKGEAYLVYTNKVPTGAFRGYGHAEGIFSLESMMERAASELSIDPLEIRMKNSTRSGDTTIHGMRISSCGLQECMKRVTEATDWHRKRANPQPYRGIGLAISLFVSGNRQLMDYDGSTAFIKIDEDGRVTLITGEGDIGQGCQTALAMIAAEELGATLDNVIVSQPDTDLVPYCLGTYADRVTMVGGNAVKVAAANARTQLLEVAADLLEASVDDLEARENKIYVKGAPERFKSLPEVAAACIGKKKGGPILACGTYDTPTEMLDRKTHYGHSSPSYAFTAVVAEVEVNPKTGVVKLVNLVSGDDCGFAINPHNAEGQVHGCMAMGIGFALMEKLVWEKGNIVNASYADYKMPTIADMPKVKSFLVETDDKFGPFGAKSIGDSTIAPTPAAIANAIYHACGYKANKLPVMPEDVYRFLKGARGK